MPRKYQAIFFATFLLLIGCQSKFGPSAIQNTHPAYNQAIAQVLNEQLLLNLIRLRYRDQAYFLKINSITASMTFSGSLGINADIDLTGAGNALSPDAGISYTDRPTISFQPLQGEDFLKSVLSSIPLESLLVMTQSGWNFERVFGLCVERINTIRNAPRASGPTPVNAPAFKQYNRLLKLIRQLQINGELEFIADAEQSMQALQVMVKVNKKNRGMVKKLARMLGLAFTNQSILSFNINPRFNQTSENQLSIRTRSISSMMFYLSHNIHVPQTHLDAGLVTMTKNQQNKLFDWSLTPAGKMFKINHSKEYPENAFLTVPYRNHWFYIADNDLESKSTFMLLTQLFDLQAGQSKASGPTLTLPVR